MDRDAPAVLLTGATGLVGGELLSRLLTTRPDCLFVLPTRRPEMLASFGSDPRLRPIVSELRDPILDGWEDRVVEIVHCAADTRFGLSLEEARFANVVTTRAILHFAKRCKRLRKLAYISTVYVAGRSTGMLPEQINRHANGFCNTYQQSKYEAEGLVSDAMADIPTAIYRLSSIIGRSDGTVRQFNYVHQLLRLFTKNVLPVAPIDPVAPVDMIASDWVGAVVDYLFTTAFTPGRIYHVSAGPKFSLTAGEMVDIAAAEFRLADYPDIRVPRFVSLAEYEAYVSEMKGKRDRLFNDLLRVLGYTLPHLGLFQGFENENTVQGLQGSNVRMPDVRDLYPKVIRCCASTAWGRGSRRA